MNTTYTVRRQWKHLLIDVELYRDLKTLSSYRGVGISALIEQICAAYINRYREKGLQRPRQKQHLMSDLKIRG
jgi:hypothetical protein